MSILATISTATAGTNGWTRNQYSIFRVALGAYMLVHFVTIAPWSSEMFSNQGCLSNADLSPLAHLFPNVLTWRDWSDSPAAVATIMTIAIAASTLLTLGIYDRASSIVLWYIWACLFGRNPFIANPALPYTGILLLAHACVVTAHKKQTQPGQPGNYIPAPIFTVVWILLACGYSYSGYTKLVSPSWLDGQAGYQVLLSPLARPTWLRQLLLGAPPVVLSASTYATLAGELFFAPLALFNCTRPFIWAVLLAMHFLFLDLIDFADLSWAMILVHAFTFDPAWIARAGSKQSNSPPAVGSCDRIFYDGDCGLCHHAVRFILAENPRPDSFRFAPLDGATALACLQEQVSTVKDKRNTGCPDSLIVVTRDGQVLAKSSAWIHILLRLGGIWRLLATGLVLLPPRWRDTAYASVARVRSSFFSRPPQTCPVDDTRLALFDS